MKLHNPIVLALCILLSGCLTIKTVNISQKTSLEHQLMGNLEPLTEQEMLLSSVRDEARLIRGDALNQDKQAMTARRRQLFNRDDLDKFKNLGCLGEALSGNPVSRPCPNQKADEQAILEKILFEEITDRQAIISWVISQHDNLQESQRSQVIQIYRQFILSRSPEGTPFQDPDGKWMVKEPSDIEE